MRLSAAESSVLSGRQMTELYWKFCDELFVSGGIKIVVSFGLEQANM